MTAIEVYASLKKLIEMHGATPEQIQVAINKYLNENGITIKDVDGGTFLDWKE